MAYSRLDRIVDLQRATTTRNAVNAPIEAWGPAAGPGLAADSQRYASKVDIKDGERERAGEVLAEATTRFQMRYDPLTSTLDATDRLICEGITYEILGVKELGRRERIEVTTSSRREKA